MEARVDQGGYGNFLKPSNSLHFKGVNAQKGFKYYKCKTYKTEADNTLSHSFF